MWGIGSQAGQDDVIPFVVTAQQCGVGFEDNNLFLTEGHSYFITVKVCILKFKDLDLCCCVCPGEIGWEGGGGWSAPCICNISFLDS